MKFFDDKTHIYSVSILQRILDHWGVGKLINVSIETRMSTSIWVHWIETNKGEFYLYSALAEPTEKCTLHKIIQSHVDSKETSKLYSDVVHSFERYHYLEQSHQKFSISTKQLLADLERLKKQRVVSVDRLIGPVCRVTLEGGVVFFSYVIWEGLVDQKKGESSQYISTLHSKPESIDTFLVELNKKELVIEGFKLNGSFTMLLKHKISFKFASLWAYPTCTIVFPNRKVRINIINGQSIWYEKTFLPS